MGERHQPTEGEPQHRTTTVLCPIYGHAIGIDALCASQMESTRMQVRERMGSARIIKERLHDVSDIDIAIPLFRETTSTIACCDSTRACAVSSLILNITLNTRAPCLRRCKSTTGGPSTRVVSLRRGIVALGAMGVLSSWIC
jgi:hypothetical protein